MDEQLRGYTGKNDLGVDLNDRRSFAEEEKMNRDFTLNITNTTGEKKVIALFPGFLRFLGVSKTYQTVTLEDGTATGDVIKDFELHYKNADLLNAAGYSVDYIAQDGVLYSNGTGELQVDSPDGLFSGLQDFVKINPMRITGMDISANDKDVFPTDFKIARLFPGQDVAVEKQPIAKYFKPTNQQSTKIIVPDTLQVDAQTVIFFEMAATQNAENNTSLQITLNLGASQNSSLLLQNKAELALDNIRY